MPIAAASTSEAAHWTAAALRLVEQVPPVFRLNAVQARAWVCVAIDDELEGKAAERLARACTAFSFTSGWSLEIPWTPGGWTPGAHRFVPSAPEFVAMSKGAYIGSCSLLMDDAEGYAATSDGDLYWMLAGPRAFVEEAIGRSVEAEMEAFGRSVDAYGGEATIAGRVLCAAQSVAAAACGGLSGPKP